MRGISFLFGILVVFVFCTVLCRCEEIITQRADNENNGNCGPDCRWFVDGYGVLTINGTGEMSNFSSSDLPWKDYILTIKTIEIKNDITSIGNYAFYWFSEVTKVSMANSVLSVGAYSFFRCSKLKNIDLSNDLTSIGPFAFSFCSCLLTITIPNKVETIGNNAFSECSNLSSIIMSNGVLSIGSQAFVFCRKLTSVSFPSSVEFIGDDVFRACYQLSSISVEQENLYFTSVEGVLFDHEINTLIRFPSGKNDIMNYSVPESVTRIENSAFESSKVLSIELPKGLLFIGQSAFESCDGIARFSIPKSVNSIGVKAFYECSSLIAVDVEEGNARFVSLEGVLFDVVEKAIINYPPKKSGNTYIIPDFVEAIGESAFTGCNNLESVIISDGVKTVGKNAFMVCDALTHITLPESLVSIGVMSFWSSFNLRHVFIQASQDNSDCGINAFFNQGVSFCVPPAYSSRTFCGYGIEFDDEECKTFRGMFNHCFKPAYSNGGFISQSRKNASLWESQSDGCIHYACDNDTGPSLWSICNETEEKYRMCLSNKCVESADTPGKNWIVQLDMENTSVGQTNTSQIVLALNTLTGVAVEELTVGMEIDEDGNIIRIFIYVETLNTARVIADAIEHCQGHS